MFRTNKCLTATNNHRYRNHKRVASRQSQRRAAVACIDDQRSLQLLRSFDVDGTSAAVGSPAWGGDISQGKSAIILGIHGDASPAASGSAAARGQSHTGPDGPLACQITH